MLLDELLSTYEVWNIYILVPVKLGYMYLSNQASGNDDYTCQFATRIMKRGSCCTKVGISLQLLFIHCAVLITYIDHM